MKVRLVSQHPHIQECIYNGAHSARVVLMFQIYVIMYLCIYMMYSRTKTREIEKIQSLPNTFSNLNHFLQMH